MGQHMGQVKVPLKMGFFPFLVADMAIFWFLTLPLCLLSCSKEVLTRFSPKKIIKAEHDRENPPNYGRHPDHGIHQIRARLSYHMIVTIQNYQKHVKSQNLLHIFYLKTKKICKNTNTLRSIFLEHICLLVC